MSLSNLYDWNEGIQKKISLKKTTGCGCSSCQVAKRPTGCGSIAKASGCGSYNINIKKTTGYGCSSCMPAQKRKKTGCSPCR